jgi:uncharacterized protein involved in response to NO
MNERPPSYLALCRVEPFRLFFPLGTLLGVSGVSLWPLFFLGLHKFYPGLMHARLMIEGFLGAFVIGFLGTAVPRLLSAPPLRGWEFWSLVLLHLSTAGLHIAHQSLAGDTVFLSLLVLFAAMLVRRLRKGTDLPPPSFALVALGYLSAVLGTALWVCGMKGWVPANAMLMGGMWLNEGFLILLVLGVGGFLFPRFLRIEGVPPLDEERKASGAWLRRAMLSFVTGALILVSYWWQGRGGSSIGPFIARAAASLIFIATMIPVHRGRNWGNTVPQAVAIALAAIVTGMVFPLIAPPSQRVAGLHVIFLAGFSVITFTVATRVILGHSGNGALFESPLVFLRVTVLLLVLGAVLRVWGDVSQWRAQLLNAASYLWMIAAVVWGWVVLPKVRVAGAD